jgi:methylated-DNA-protein-cysteine methyltransferase-like protein
MSSFYSAVYEAVKRIPKGKVTNYGTIAALAGRPRSSRLVGWALHVNPDPNNIPCHRVVMRDGSLAPAFAFGGLEIQRMLLEKEGVGFTEDGKVDMVAYGVDMSSFYDN